jgi:hypothetical protein
MPPDDSGRQAELRSDRTHLVLEQRAQRLHQLELQIVGQSADIVMALDIGGTLTATGLNNVRIQRSLYQELNLTGLADHLAGSSLERPNAQPTDDLALLLGINGPRIALRGTAQRRRRPLRSTPVAAT